MSFNMSSKTSYENVSLCVYIGNTSSFDDQILINYCSQFGQIISCSIDNCPDDKRLFCDFRIIEFATKQQLEYFLHRSIHKIGSIILDIKLYKNLLDNSEILNIDRKLFIGPTLNSNNINTIVQFYKLIDPNLQYCLSLQYNQRYILIEFSNRQYVRTIIEQKTIPKTIDNQIFTIHTPIHPKELISKKMLTKKNQYQISINGLTNQITENILIDYFDKRATVVACHILSTDRKSAIIEFDNEKSVQQLLEIPVIRLHGVNLLLNKVSDTISSSSIIENTEEYNNDEIDQLLEGNSSNSIFHSPPVIRNEPINQQVIEPISIPSPDISECGWTSPPRAIMINHYPLVDHPPERSSSKPSITTTTTITDSINELRVIQTDRKSIKNLTNNILKFVEQYQNEIDQIKDEYMMKFTKDQTSIEHEINRLMNDERITFDKLERYLYKQRRHSTKS